MKRLIENWNKFINEDEIDEGVGTAALATALAMGGGVKPNTQQNDTDTSSGTQTTQQVDAEVSGTAPAAPPAKPLETAFAASPAADIGTERADLTSGSGSEADVRNLASKAELSKLADSVATAELPQIEANKSNKEKPAEDVAVASQPMRLLS